MAGRRRRQWPLAPGNGPPPPVIAARVRTPPSERIDLMAAESAELDLHERVDHVIARSGLRAHFGREGQANAESRLENLDELVSVASRFQLGPEDEEAGLDELTAFLAHATLEAGDTQGDPGQDCVQLMTLHAAKGLEFPQVFLTGMEEGLFPSRKSLEEDGRLEEERRLAYVGITRAREKLTLSYAESRRLHGVETFNRLRASWPKSRLGCCMRCARATPPGGHAGHDRPGRSGLARTG